MLFRAADVLDATAACFSERLIPASRLQLLRSIADRLPACAETIGFECRLNGAGRVDLGIGVPLGNESACALLADSTDQAAAPGDAWARIRAFVARRAEPDAGFATRMPFMFLEFDADDTPPARAPSVFIALDWPLGELVADGCVEGPAPLTHVREALQLLVGRPLPRDTDAMLARCFVEIPAGGIVLHVAAMLSRPGGGVRLSIGVPRSRTGDYLRTLGWPGAVTPLEDILARFSPYADFEHPGGLVQLDFDVEPQIGPLLGVTVRPSSSDGWRPLLDQLVHAGLCAADERDALLSWPGRTRAQLPGVLLPCVLERYVSHTKVTCGAAHPKAKAYIGVVPRPPRGWMPPA